jgi:RNA polymerase sigma-70 factor (ECF subfamily)
MGTPISRLAPPSEKILQRGELQDYYLAHAARADLLRRTGDRREAHAAYGSALSLAQSEPVRRFLRRRLKELAEIA